MKLPICHAATLAVLLLTIAVSAKAQAQAEEQELTSLNAQLSRQYAADKFDDALATSDRIIVLVKKAYPGESLDLAAALKNRGFIEIAKGDTKRGIKTLQDAADIFNKHTALSKADGATYAAVLEAIAAVRMATSTVAGEDHLELALQWRQRSNGAEASETASTLARLANVKFWKGDYKTAAAMYHRATIITTKATKNLADDQLAAIRERTRCSYRKAKMDDGIVAFDSELKAVTSTLPESVRNRNTMISGGVLNGKAKYLPKPAYPADARQNRASGSVEIQVLINEKGDILSACAISGNRYLIEASELSALGAKFTPTLLAGEPVKVSGIIVYNFVP